MYKSPLYFLIFCVMMFTGQLSSAQSLNNPSQKSAHVEQLLKKAEQYLVTDSEKSFIYLNEALKFKDDIDEKQLLQLYKLTAVAYSQASNLLALEYCYKYLELQGKVDKSRLYIAYNNLGGNYMSLGDTIKAREFWTLSLRNLKASIANGQIKEKNIEAYALYNNLALLEIGDRNYSKALEMLHIYKKHSLNLKDTSSIIIAYQNLADVFSNLKESDSSKYYLDRAISLARRSKSNPDLAYLYYDRGNTYSKTLQDSALYYLQTAFDLSERYNINEIKLSSAKRLATFYSRKGDYKRSNEYLLMANHLSEQNIKLQNKKRIKLLEFDNKYKMKQQQDLNDAKKRENIFIFSFILLITICIIAFLMYRLQKTKAKRREAEISLLIQKMETKNKELTSNAIQMLQHNEIIEATHKELNQLKSIADSSTTKMLSQIISDLKNDSQSFNKKEFEKLFIETNEAFYRKLLEKYPTLTSNEIRLCAFAKMNFSTKEISAITRQSNNSILVARSRLRKKMNLDENQSLAIFLNSI